MLPENSGITTKKPELKTDLDFCITHIDNSVKLSRALQKLGVEKKNRKKSFFDPLKTFLSSAFGW